MTFRPEVRITEYSRKLDGGGTVPTDGSLVTVGLGKPVRLVQAPLARPRTRPEEDVVWLPSRTRVHLLRKSMGDARYYRAWARHRWEMSKIRRLREQSKSDDADRLLMPTSAEQARKRAVELARQAGVEGPTLSPSKLVTGQKRRHKADTEEAHLRYAMAAQQFISWCRDF